MSARKLLLASNKTEVAEHTAIGPTRLSRLAHGHEQPSLREVDRLSAVLGHDLGGNLPTFFASWYERAGPDLAPALKLLASLGTAAAGSLGLEVRPAEVEVSIGAPADLVAALCVPPGVRAALVRRGLPSRAAVFEVPRAWFGEGEAGTVDPVEGLVAWVFSATGQGGPQVALPGHQPRLECEGGEAELFVVDAAWQSRHGKGSFPVAGSLDGHTASSWVLHLAVVEVPSPLSMVRLRLAGRAGRSQTTSVSLQARIGIPELAAAVAPGVQQFYADLARRWTAGLKFLCERLHQPSGG